MKNHYRRSEPSRPTSNKLVFRGPLGGTFTYSDRGNKVYFGNNKK